MASKDAKWCAPVKADSGLIVYGGAARNVRIKRGGGIESITQRAAAKAAQEVLDEVNGTLQVKRARILRLVSNG